MNDARESWVLAPTTIYEKCLVGLGSRLESRDSRVESRESRLETRDEGQFVAANRTVIQLKTLYAKFWI